jgi:hypothetical protein
MSMARFNLSVDIDQLIENEGVEAQVCSWSRRLERPRDRPPYAVSTSPAACEAYYQARSQGIRDFQPIKALRLEDSAFPSSHTTQRGSVRGLRRQTAAGSTLKLNCAMSIVV